MSVDFYHPTDMEKAHIEQEAMCGHGAFAAALGISVLDAMEFFERGGWVNIPMMRAALAKAGRKVVKVLQGGNNGPETTLTMIQFLGSWMDPKTGPYARCRYRHWVCTRGNLLWDANGIGWNNHHQWRKRLVPQLLPPRSTGWEAFRSLVLEEKSPKQTTPDASCDGQPER